MGPIHDSRVTEYARLAARIHDGLRRTVGDGHGRGAGCLRGPAALEGQTWPRELFEVVVGDDGSPEPLERPAATSLDAGVVGRLRAGLGLAAVGTSVVPGGFRVTITRAWALHRAQRTPWEASDFGEAVTIPFAKLRPRRADSLTPDRLSRAWRRVRAEWRLVDSPAAAWWFARWLKGAVLWQVSRHRAE